MIDIDSLNIRVPGLKEMTKREEFVIDTFSKLKKHVAVLSGKFLPYSICFMDNYAAAGICFPISCPIISISIQYVNCPFITEDDIRDTLLHELTHALIGNSYGHGKEWLCTNVLLGGRGQIFCSDFKSDDKTKYVIRCPFGCMAKRQRFHKKTWENKKCALHNKKLNVIII